jgi:hypothetical protein
LEDEHRTVLSLACDLTALVFELEAETLALTEDLTPLDFPANYLPRLFTPAVRQVFISIL